jgi:oligosaccharide reducing-end xylanase
MNPSRSPSLVALLSAIGLGCSAARSGAVPSEAAAVQPAEAQRASAAPAPAGAVPTGKYRNLFAELGKSARDVDAKLSDAYQRLFHGSADEALMFDAGRNERGPLGYIHDIGNDDVRSEGMSYGMMIAVQCDRKNDFDALWNWSKTYMQVNRAAHPVSGYFAWRLKTDGTVIDEMPAPDGEEYLATALLFAAYRWGPGAGIYDYEREALDLLASMKNRAPITGLVHGDRETTVVALFNAEQRMVRFTPDTGNFQTNGDHTDPSYHLPAFYELWAHWGPEDDRSFWAEAALASREHFVKVAHPSTGLTPDYSNFDATPKAASWDAGTVNFRYDAWRTAMNWSVDSAWWAKDPRQAQLSNRLLAFFSEQGDDYSSRYTLDGKPLDQDHSLGLVATNAVAALAATDPRASRFVEALYQASPPTGKWRYYNGMLYMLALLHVSGNFRVYGPQPG